MENDNAVGGVAKLEETKGGESEIVEPTVSDTLACNMDRSKESDEDEVFEEAVEAGPTMVDSDDSVITEDGNIKSIGITGSNMENTNVVGDKMAEHLVDENNEMINDVMVEDGKLDSTETVDDAIPNDVTVKNLSSENAEGLADADPRKEGALQPSGPSESTESQGDPEKLDMKGSINEIPEVQVANEVKGGDSSFQMDDNGIPSDVNLVGTLNKKGSEMLNTDSLKEQTNVTSAETGGSNGAKGSEYIPRLESETNGNILQNEKWNVTSNNHDYQPEQIESTPSNSLDEYKEDLAGEKENSPVPNVVPEGNRSISASDANPDILSALTEGSEKDVVKDWKKKECFSGNVTTPSSHSHTTGAALLQEPVCLGNSVNNKQENKPKAADSFANSVKPQPPNLDQNVPLVEPAPSSSTNKEQVSRPAADNLPANSNLPSRPAGLGRAAPLLEPHTSRTVQHPRVNGAVSPAQNQLIKDPTNGEAEEYDETREKLQMIRVKFLRLAHRLGQTPHNVVVAQVLYRLGLAEQLQGRTGGRVAAFSFDRASAVAEQLESAGQEPLDFTCTIMVIGKTGVGKSATINSIFDDVMFSTDAFQLGTKKVQDIVGTVQGIRVRVIDTPGLLPSWSDQCQNEKILRSVKKFIKKTPPDIVLYLDRLDMQSREFGDMPLLRTITEIFGQSIWFNAIVVLTHAASAPPEGPNGTATSYDTFVTQRSHVVQQAIRQAAGDMRLMNPVSLVENHSACRTNRAGQRVLPNGQVWKPHLLLLSFASKILAEANTLLKLQDGPPGKSFAPRTRSPPLPFLLSSLLQSRPEVKLPSEQFGDDDDIIDDLDDSSDSDSESEYDELPPFRPLTKAQLEKLNRAQRKAYYDELEYREKLLMKKQLKEEKQRRKMAKKIEMEAKNLPADYGENAEEEVSGAASVPVPMPDMALPASFDSDNPTHRYRSLDSSNPWLVRAVLEPNGWDHDIGYDGINVERLFVVKDKLPVSFSGHLSKDKKDGNLQMEVASTVKHGKGKVTSLGFDMQSVGKDFAYTLRSETRFSNHRLNKAVAGLSTSLLGDVFTGGLKIEDKLLLGKRGQLVVSGGAMYGRGDVAYGGSLEATLRDKDNTPISRFLSTLAISVMDWHGDLAIGCNFQIQIPVGRHENLIGRLNLNNKGSGQMSVRLNSSEQLHIALIGLIPLVKKLLNFSQPVQYG